MITAILTLIALSQPTPKYDPSVLQSIRDSSVRVQFKVRTDDFGNYRLASSSGTVVDATKDSFTVLTCSHGLYDHGRKFPAYIIIGPVDSGVKYAGKVLADDRDRDVAVLSVSAPDHKFKLVKVAAFAPKLTTPIIRCGFPKNTHRVIVSGTLLRSVYINGRPEAKAWAATPAAVGGDSGGGVFTNSGELVGVTVMSDGLSEMTVSSHDSVQYILKQAGVRLR